jgi:hypothetical protein
VLLLATTTQQLGRMWLQLHHQPSPHALLAD